MDKVLIINIYIKLFKRRSVINIEYINTRKNTEKVSVNL